MYLKFHEWVYIYTKILDHFLHKKYDPLKSLKEFQKIQFEYLKKLLLNF